MIHKRSVHQPIAAGEGQPDDGAGDLDAGRQREHGGIAAGGIHQPAGDGQAEVGVALDLLDGSERSVGDVTAVTKCNGHSEVGRYYLSVGSTHLLDGSGFASEVGS